MYSIFKIRKEFLKCRCGDKCSTLLENVGAVTYVLCSTLLENVGAVT